MKAIICNCVKKPEKKKFRTSTRFEPVTSRYRSIWWISYTSLAVSSMSTFACVIWCLRPPNSERDKPTLSHVTLIQWKVVHNHNFELPPRLSNLTHNRHRQERKLYKCRNNSILSIAMFHASSVGLRYSLVCTCFSFFISTELVTKRNRYICVSICSMFQMIDIESLLMPLPGPVYFWINRCYSSVLAEKSYI